MACFIACGLSSLSARPVVASFDRFFIAADDDALLTEGGLLLLNELNCVACHAVPATWKQKLPGRGKVDLSGVGSRLAADDLQLFIRDPHRAKDGTLMPGLFAGEEDQGKGALESLTAYLASLKGAQKEYPVGNAKDGSELYHTVGCVACHAPADVADYRPVEVPEGMPVIKQASTSVPLVLGKKYAPPSLAAFLQDPLSIRHGGRMPSTELTDQEAADIAAYLHYKREPSSASKTTASPAASQAIADGRKQFANLGCVSCHDAGESQTTSPLATLDTVSPDQGCLSPAKKTGVPEYALSPLQQKAIRLALARLQQPPATQTAAQRADTHLLQMNCYACHQWNGKGGLEEGRAPYFTVKDATAHSLGELGRLPPKLDAVGRKLTQGWMEKLLWGQGGGVRPYMTARMPRFGRDNAAPVIPLLEEACKLEKPVAMDSSGLRGHQRAEAGRVLMGVGKGGLGCVSCHGLKDRKSLGVPVVNLSHTVDRLQPAYFKELLLNPQVTQPGTLMPPLFMGRKKADNEIEQLWTYLKEIDQARLPEGLLQTGDYELKPAEKGRPIVFRTFLVGAGTQAVAVGYPSQLNVAFDSYEVRWALTWQGRFVDAMTTWEERAMTPAKPLEDKVTTLPVRMPLAKLRSASDSWPESFGTDAGYVFQGYRMGKDGTPVFLYKVGDLTVEDVLQPAMDGKSLVRTLILTSGGGVGDDWYFLGLTGTATPTKITWQDGMATVQETLPLTLTLPP